MQSAIMEDKFSDSQVVAPISSNVEKP
jgi:hypothetical protein